MLHAPRHILSQGFLRGERMCSIKIWKCQVYILSPELNVFSEYCLLHADSQKSIKMNTILNIKF